MNLKEFWGLYRLKFTDIKLTVASFTHNALFKKHHMYRSGVSPVIHSTFNSLVKVILLNLLKMQKICVKMEIKNWENISKPANPDNRPFLSVNIQ